MKKVKIQRKLSKSQKSLLIGLLIGDGTICSNYVFKLSHSNEQLEYLKWKIKLLNDCNIKTNGIKNIYLNVDLILEKKLYIHN